MPISSSLSGSSWASAKRLLRTFISQKKCHKTFVNMLFFSKLILPNIAIFVMKNSPQVNFTRAVSYLFGL
jgi:hypothetical protein